MSDFRFANPEWSSAMWGVIVLAAALLWLESRRGDALSRLMSLRMQSRLVFRASAMRRYGAIVLVCLAAVCGVLALMRPQHGLTYIKSPRVGAQIMFCLDVSKSMLAEDVAPNRLERAKADIVDLLSLLDGDQVGLIGFAGRATVLCPITPDYGFFKLILENAGPGSVGRGGTRLEEPLRKALDGFRTESDVSRVIYLITDGEDHDSKPLDVAKDAIERGIKVVAVGVGDESGSEIRITDPRTGVQTQVTDADGNPVVTRLDGQMLRELALATEGVYIPAGTGTLDLRSIYEAHLKPLVRSQMQSEGRAIRQDAFQWMIMLAMVLLLGGLIVSAGGANEDIGRGEADESSSRSSSLVRAAGILALGVILLFPKPTLAAETEKANAPPESSESKTGETEQDPRELYNQGFAKIRTDFDEAESLLVRARQNARGDGEVRFRSTYNMGWVEINRADSLLETEPEKALEHLQRAAGWFRDTLRLRDDFEDARHNLEVVSKRILQLRDQLNKKDPKKLAARLDELIETQRGTIAGLRTLVSQVTENDDPNIAEKFRAPFQRLAIDQRVALSDLQSVVEAASQEMETLQGKAEDQRTPEEVIRMVQLQSVLGYLGGAGQRIGQSRSQLRRRQASRGFRRASSGLRELNRARDQLRDPVQILDAILSDLVATAQQTAQMALEASPLAGANPQLQPPAWLGQEYLVDNQADITNRLQEINDRFVAGLKQQEQSPPDEDDPSAKDTDASQDQMITRIRSAMPHLREASDAIKTADAKLALPEYPEANESQVIAIQALQRAREQFLDLRGLIEITYNTESELASLLERVLEESKVEEEDRDKEADGNAEIEESDLKPDEEKEDSKPEKESDPKEDKPAATDEPDEASEPDETEEPDQTEEPDETAGSDTQVKYGDLATGSEQDHLPVPPEIIELLSEQQSINLDRTERLLSEIKEQLEEQMTEVPPDSADQQADQIPAERQRLEMAIQLATDARTQMKDIMESIGPEPGEPSKRPEASEIKGKIDGARSTLEDLRRLFFSIVEHLRETAQRQAKLNDETEQAAGIQAESKRAETADPDSEIQAQAQQLSSTQQDLAGISAQIAEALTQQASQAEAADAGGQADPQQQAMMQENAEKAGRAATMVEVATEKMGLAKSKLDAGSVQFAEARSPQDEALQKLIEALKLLQPPQDQQQNEQQQQQQQQQQNQQQEQPEPEEDQQEQMDPSRALQAVRDREAERRREKNERRNPAQLPVAKDW